MRRWLACLLLAACAVPAQAGLFDDTEARNQIGALRGQIDDTSRRLETLTQHQVEFSNQVESLRGDIAKLRGQLDELAYNLDAAQKRQKDFYIDLDNRLRRLEAPIAEQQAATQAASEAATREYEAALASLRATDFKAALAGFEGVIRISPQGPQAAGAHFFAAYCHANLRQAARAAEMYGRFMESWPQDERVPDAMLGRAESLQSLGQPKEARALLADLVEKFPASEAGKQAKARLKKK